VVTPKEYERAVLEHFKTIFPPPNFVVRHDVRLPGTSSKSHRQINVGVFEADKAMPSLIIEAKRHSRRINVSHAGMTIGLVRDVGGLPAARNQLAAEGIHHLTITLQEAQSLRWLAVLDERFPIDREFREVSGQLIECLLLGDAGQFMDSELPYEEWLAVLRTGQSLFPNTTSTVLLSLARDHYDDGVRFNAIQLLDEAGSLTEAAATELLAGEQDPETVQLLIDLAHS
jgi:hypothetical protein